MNALFYQPLDQFEIYFLSNWTSLNILGIYIKNFFLFYFLIDLHLLNLIIYGALLLFVMSFFSLQMLTNRLKFIYLTIWQFLYELFMFKFILNMLVGQVGKRGQSYLIFVSTIFYFILISNVIGLVPFSFTITSHISVTFMIGASTIIGLTILGFYNQHLHFLELFVPKGVPQALLPLLVVIEVISYIARGFSLAIRLFANLMAGHSLLHILLSFLIKICKVNYILGCLGLLLIIAIFVLELGISFLQAYVFIVLVSIYLKDAYEVHH